MNQLAKKIAESLNISYNCKVTKIEKTTQGWQIILEEGESLLSKQVTLTCPLPQSLDILTNSGIPFEPQLSNLK